MPKEPHPFEKLGRSEDYQERMSANASVAFEEGKVRYILGVFKMNIRKAENSLREREESERGRPDLTFRSFNDAYPSFPLVLGSSRLHGVRLHLDTKSMLPALFKQFGQAPFVTAYDEFYEQRVQGANGRKVGLVFPRKGFKNGLIIYCADGVDDIPLCERESVFGYVGGNKKHRNWLLVRSFQSLLTAIHNQGHGWRPDET